MRGVTNLSDGDKFLHNIDDWIRHYKGKGITWEKGFMDTNYFTHITDVFDNFFNNTDNLEEIAIEEKDKPRYQYNPKLLSYDLYGTIDLWQLILILNDYTHPGEFDLNKKFILVPKERELASYFQTVYTIIPNYFGNLGSKW